MKKAKHLAIVENRKLQIVESALQQPASQEVTIYVKACGVCAGDLHMVSSYKKEAGKEPIFLGHEAVGKIAAVGSEVTGYKVGDNVASIGGGGMCNYYNVPVRHITKLPDAIAEDDWKYWLVEPALCVANTLELVAVKPGAKVAVAGVGFFGLLFVQALSKSFVGSLAAFDIDVKKLTMAKNFGADVCYNLADAATEQELRQQENSFDVVIETASVQPTLDLSTRMVKTGGTLGIYSWHKGARHFDGTTWHLKGLRVLNTSPMMNPNILDLFAPTVRLMEKGVFDFKPLVTHWGPLEDAQKIFDIGIDKKDNYIKGVIIND